MTEGTAKVILVDDDAAVRRSLARLLRAAGYQVETFETAQAFFARGRPDEPACLVLDVYLPDLNGLELQRRLGANGSALPIVFITGSGDVPTSVRALKSGAVDFLLKPCDAGDLLAAVAAGLKRSVEHHRAQARSATLRRRFLSLTSREREVFLQVVRGAPNKRIAAELGITERTVKLHRSRVMTKMAAQSLAELVQFAGLLELPQRKPASGG